MTSPLAELLDAVRRGSCLPWLIVHAPDGDADAAVRRAWEGEPSTRVLINVARAPHGLYVLSGWASARCATCRAAGPLSAACDSCRDLLRSMVQPPTFQELTRGAT